MSLNDGALEILIVTADERWGRISVAVTVIIPSCESCLLLPRRNVVLQASKPQNGRYGYDLSSYDKPLTIRRRRRLAIGKNGEAAALYVHLYSITSAPSLSSSSIRTPSHLSNKSCCSMYQPVLDIHRLLAHPPYSHCSIPAARRQILAIRAELQMPHGSSMLCKILRGSKASKYRYHGSKAAGEKV